MFLDFTLVALGPLFHISLNEELTPGRERSLDRIEQWRAKNEAFFVPLLPPRVGKMQIHAGERARYKPRHDQASVLGEHSTAPRKLALGQALVHDRRPFPLDLKAHDSHVRIRLQPLHSEPAATGPYLEFDRLLHEVAVEDPA